MYTRSQHVTRSAGRFHSVSSSTNVDGCRWKSSSFPYSLQPSHRARHAHSRLRQPPHLPSTVGISSLTFIILLCSLLLAYTQLLLPANLPIMLLLFFPLSCARQHHPIIPPLLHLSHMNVSYDPTSSHLLSGRPCHNSLLLRGVPLYNVEGSTTLILIAKFQ